jgi:hypothetical protein
MGYNSPKALKRQSMSADLNQKDFNNLHINEIQLKKTNDFAKDILKY